MNFNNECHPTTDGWFQVVAIMVGIITNNVSTSEYAPFLREVGESLAVQFPLQESITVNDLEIQFNHVLEKHGWGAVKISAEKTCLHLHHSIPLFPRTSEHNIAWPLAFGHILEGLYSCWLIQQGGDMRFHCRMVDTCSSGITFRYVLN